MTRFLTCLLQITAGALLTLCVCATVSVAAEPAAKASTKALFCAYGGVGMEPSPPPPGFELEFAVAVVEIDSPKKTANVAFKDFVLFDRTGKATKLKRLVTVEQFDEPRISTEGTFGYYTNTVNGSGTRPWNGTLPAGRIRLRVRIALEDRPVDLVRFKLTVGRYVIEGPVDGEWPTG